MRFTLNAVAVDVAVAATLALLGAMIFTPLIY